MDTIIEVPELLQKIETLTTQLAELMKQLSEKTVLIDKMKMLIEYYETQFLMLRRRQFGASSERTIIDTDEYRQMGLFNNAEILSKPLPEPEIEEITYTRKKHKGKREEDLSGLPVERIEHELPEENRVCPACGETMHDIGVDIRRELKLIPAQVIVEEHATHAYACKNCQNNSDDSTPVVKADAPAALIPGSLASPSLVAHIIVQKYLNAMPLYRLENGFLYDGVIVSRQTMANWVIQCADTYLSAIYSLLIESILKESVLHADETTVQVLHEPGRAAQSNSYEWVYRTSGYAFHPTVVFEYQQTRKQEYPIAFLKEFKGFLHTDGYQAYHNLPLDIIIVGCWAHARRKWENLFKALPKDKRKDSDAERGLKYINTLFDFERNFKGLSPQQRYEKRLEKSKPVADAFFAWVETLGALPKSPLGEAAHYALSQRTYLENVFLDGRLELSNNRCENSIRPFVRGRKGWLFCNTPNGARASSIMYSIIETAKANLLHPFQYIKFLLERLPNAKADQLESFLPWSDTLPDICRAPEKVAGRKSNKQ